MTLANLYPITASLGMVGYRSYDTAVNWNIEICSCSLVLAVVISAILILCMIEREATQTKKRSERQNQGRAGDDFMKKIVLPSYFPLSEFIQMDSLKEEGIRYIPMVFKKKE